MGRAAKAAARTRAFFQRGYSCLNVFDLDCLG
jgi:hypothetical protein